MVAIGSKEIFLRALSGLLKPVVKYAIRSSLKFREISEILKVEYARSAAEELAQLGQSVTVSKLSAMTGLQRRDLTKILDPSIEDVRPKDLIARVIGLWQSAQRYCDKQGKPKTLVLNGRESEFGSLVSEVSTDLNPYTVVFELERIGAIKQTEKGITLIMSGYQPIDDLDQSLNLLTQDMQDLYMAVEENIFSGNQPNNLHIKTQYDNIPISKESEVRAWLLAKGAELHKECRKYLSQFDRDINPKIKKLHPDDSSVRIGIGTFSFAEEAKEKD